MKVSTAPPKILFALKFSRSNTVHFAYITAGSRTKTPPKKPEFHARQTQRLGAKCLYESKTIPKIHALLFTKYCHF